MSTQLPFSVYFEPVAKFRDNVRLLSNQKFYRVEYIEPMEPIIVNLGELGAGKSTSLYELEELDLDDLEMGQWRFTPLEDINIKFYQPRANERGTTKTSSTEVSPYLLFLDPTLKHTEFFTFEDSNRAYIQATNPGSLTVIARTLFFGWKFYLEPLKETPAKYTDIPNVAIKRAKR